MGMKNGDLGLYHKNIVCPKCLMYPRICAFERERWWGGFRVEGLGFRV
jgi:hypothetical protein